MQLRSVYADRGFGSRIADQALSEQRVDDAVIPRRGTSGNQGGNPNRRRRCRFRNGL
jgi:hypothetical protein